ncbi:MAG TPA: T9SS type A sorting domain-containing protein [Bacteroidales bacterium]|nr:T9SS type A sorting domain-containing protein [Bacteroidales bacterium]
MKKHLLLILTIALLCVNGLNAQQEIMIGFTFPDNTAEEFTPDQGLSGNLTYDLRAESLTVDPRDLTFTEGATTYAASVDGWDAGANDKFWSIKFKANGYQNFKVSSKMYSDATGPKEFKLQWKMSGGDWADVTNGTITVASDWTTGVLTDLILPTDLNDPGSTSISLRWIMTSNTSVNGGTVEATGISKIDDIIVYGSPVPEPVTIIGFDFADDTDTEFNADSGIEANLGYDIRAENGAAQTTRTLTYTEGTTDFAATASEWDNGADDKFWSIKFKADGFSQMAVSSKQYSDATGPKNFKLQWKISGGEYADVADGNIALATDWTTGIVEELALPTEMEGQGSSSLYIRWIMTDNVSVSDGTVDAVGISKIDDIVVEGIAPSGIVTELYNSEIMIYPNPCDDYFTLETTNDVNRVEIYNIQGALVYSLDENFTGSIIINTVDFSSGMYFVKLYSEDTKVPSSKKLIVN